jgi:hypothetical protein
MTVNRADANGAGSGSAVGSAAAVDSTGKTPAAALPSNSTGQGRAASSGGPLPPVSTQPVQGKTKAPLDLDAINKALARIVGASAELRAATTVEKVGKAEEKLRAAQSLLCAAIRAEAESHAGRSSFAPGQYDPGDLGKVEELIASAYTDLGEKSYVRDAIRRNQGDRLAIEISNLSDAVKTYNGELSPAKLVEGNQIIRDAIKWVGGPRASDHSADAAQVKEKQFERLAVFLKEITVRNKHLDGRLVADVVLELATYMNLSSEHDFRTLQSIVTVCRNSKLDDWIAMKLRAWPDAGRH